MATFEEVQQNLTFLNTGQNQTPGLIVMKLDANGGNYGQYKHIVVLFNATNAQITFTDGQLQGLKLSSTPCRRAPATRPPANPPSTPKQEPPPSPPSPPPYSYRGRNN